MYDNYFHRTLKIGSDAYQTVLDRMHPEEPVLDYLQPFIFMAKNSPGDTCLLGLGGGAVAHALAPYLGDYTITAVESNPEIIAAAFEYFMIKRIKQLQIVCEDANSFITKITTPPTPPTAQTSTRLPFKHILIDLFNEESFPSECFNETFFSNCKKILQQDGFLAINVANKEEHKPIFKLLRQQFASAILCIPVKKSSNIVFLAANAGSINNLLNCFKKSKLLKRLTWDSIWGAVAELKFFASDCIVGHFHQSVRY